MAEETQEKIFQPIETQEALNDVIRSRLERERAKYADYEDLKKKVAGYESQLAEAGKAQERITELEKAVADRDATIQKQELASLKVSIALAAGLPADMSGRLAGTTAEELKADAELLAGMFKSASAAVPPLRNAESVQDEDGVIAAFKKLNPNLKF